MAGELTCAPSELLLCSLLLACQSLMGSATACLTLELWLFLFSPERMRTVSSPDCSSLSCSLSRAGTVFQYSVEAVWTSKLSYDLVLLSMTRGMLFRNLSPGDAAGGSSTPSTSVNQIHL